MSEQKRIAVVGATGRIGRHVVDVLNEGGHDVVPVSRATGVDLITGDGLAEALRGVTRVIEVAGGSSPDQHEATQFFTTAARNLQHAASDSGVEQIVMVSILGVDKFRGGYPAAKHAHEQSMVSGPVPVQVLRAGVFFEFVPVLVEWGTRGDATYVRNELNQPVAARTVAEALVDLAATARPSADGVLEIAGPRAERMVDMATLLVDRRGLPLRVEGVSDPSDPDRELYESGAMLAGPTAILAGPTFEQWVDAPLPILHA